MACNRPKDAWRLVGGDISFARSPREPVLEALKLPCYQCAGCRQRRVLDWRTRILHESTLHASSVFGTLTYSDEHLPKDRGLHVRDFQLFMKALRTWIERKGDGSKVRIFYCGEYGSPLNGSRPHWHFILFGFDFPDKAFWAGEGDHRRYKSELLGELWGRGMTELGTVTAQSCAYVAGYVTKKINGAEGFERYLRSDPVTGRQWLVAREMAHMSSGREGGGGIGARFVEKWKSDIFPGDFCVIDGKKAAVPQFYRRKLKKSDPEMYERVVAKRKAEALKRWADNTPARLAVKEEIILANQARMQRAKI